jgi:hypothetical protein
MARKKATTDAWIFLDDAFKLLLEDYFLSSVVKQKILDGLKTGAVHWHGGLEGQRQPTDPDIGSPEFWGPGLDHVGWTQNWARRISRTEQQLCHGWVRDSLQVRRYCLCCDSN